MEDRVFETNPKAAVRGVDSYPAIISLTHISVQELPENELIVIVSATKECTSLENRVMETIFNAAVRGLIPSPYPGDSCLLSDAHVNPEIV